MFFNSFKTSQGAKGDFPNENVEQNENVAKQMAEKAVPVRSSAIEKPLVTEKRSAQRKRAQKKGAQKKNAQEKDAIEKQSIIKEQSVIKEQSATEKESSVAEESESRLEQIKKESNSKQTCSNCGQPTLINYYGDEDEEGETTVSYLRCLNCHFSYAYFDKYEKAEKEKDKDGLNWSAGFFLLVAMLFVIITIKNEQGEQPFNNEATIESIDTETPDQSVRPDVFTDRPSSGRVLNAAEPFEIENNR